MPWAGGKEKKRKEAFSKIKGREEKRVAQAHELTGAERGTLLERDGFTALSPFAF